MTPTVDALLSADRPRFTETEQARRRTVFARAMEAAEVRYALVYGANRSGTAVPWLSGWPVTREAVLLVSPGEREVLLVQFYNHVPNARELATDCEVRWGGSSSIVTAIDILRRKMRPGERVGVVGDLPYEDHRRLVEATGETVDLGPAYVGLRIIKSPEEIAWLRVGAELSDRSIDAMRAEVRPGHTERDLGAIVEGAYLGAGGVNYIHYFGVTSMADPERCVPAQFPTGRKIAPGDVIFTEISASFWGYPGQVLRTFTVAADPTPLYEQLHRTAESAFDAIVGSLRPGATPEEVVEQASVIEAAGFTLYDDLVHGFGGGYLPPVIRSRGSSLGPLPEMQFEAGMTVVVQPNVITPDEKAGVQTGGLMLVTETGREPLHRSQRGLLRIA